MKYSELFRILKKEGWFEIRQSGGHVIMKHSVKKGSLTIPYHGSKEVGKGLLRAIIKQSGIKIHEK